MRRVRRGDPLTIPPARHANAMSDAAAAFQRPPDPEPGYEPETVEAFNATGSDHPAWTILGIDVPAVKPNDDEWQFRVQNRWKVVDYEHAKHWNRFAILQQGCRDGAGVLAVWRGLTTVRVRFHNPYHEYAIPQDGAEAEMDSAFAGCPIIWKEDLTPAELTDIDNGTPVVKWAQIDLNPAVGITVDGYLTGTLEPAEVDLSDELVTKTQAVRVWHDDPADGVWKPTATNAAGTIDLVNRDEHSSQISGVFVTAIWDGRIWKPLWISCAVSSLPNAG